MFKDVKTFMRYVSMTFLHFVKVGCSHRAASLAFASLLALVPLMTVGFGILAAFPVFKNLVVKLQDFIFSNFVAATGTIVQNYLTSFIDKAGQLSAIGLLFLIITAIAMMTTMEQTFNVIWQVKKRRRWVVALVLYWTILTLSPILIGIGFAISSYLASIAFIVTATKTLSLSEPFLALLPFLLSILSFTLIYTAVPNCEVPVRNAFIAAIIAAILFEGGKHLFTIFVTKFAAYQVLYGALATIPIFLLWVYVCWLITLFGAVISFVITRPPYELLDSPTLPHNPVHS